MTATSAWTGFMPVPEEYTQHRGISDSFRVVLPLWLFIPQSPAQKTLRSRSKASCGSPYPGLPSCNNGIQMKYPNEPVYHAGIQHSPETLNKKKPLHTLRSSKQKGDGGGEPRRGRRAAPSVQPGRSQGQGQPQQPQKPHRPPPGAQG